MCDSPDRKLRHMDRVSVQARYETDLSVAEDVAWALTKLDKITQWLLDQGVAARREQQLTSTDSPAHSEYCAGRADAFFAAEQHLSQIQALP